MKIRVRSDVLLKVVPLWTWKNVWETVVFSLITIISIKIKMYYG